MSQVPQSVQQSDDEPLYTPSSERAEQSRMMEFLRLVNDREKLNLSTYEQLHGWSVGDVPAFWGAFWEYADIVASKNYDQVVDDPAKMPGASWFRGARLNFAENLLRFRDNRSALIFRGEDQVASDMTYAELYVEVERLTRSLRALGVRPGDRVVGLMPNMPETIVAMLATTAIGGVWSSCSPDFGVQGVLDRFGQIAPRVIITTDGYYFKGKLIDCMDRVAEIAEGLPSVEKVLLVPYADTAPDVSRIPRAVRYADFLEPISPDAEIVFEQLPFDHPVYVMYSSGTTGLPKCMVQGPGVLLNHLKELMLHTDLRQDDRIFYFTTCGWMMWNWLASALGVGATLVLYDGNPFYPGPDALWNMARELRINVFGTSARYITALQEAGFRLTEALPDLRTILSTGSPLPRDGFRYVYDAIQRDVQLSSIAGGTDLNGCFTLGNPLLPVFAGEIQCRGLGMKVEIFDDEGQPVTEEQGELVCTAAFPSMPLYFWDDPDGRKYRDAYFDVYPGIWRHGDFARLSERGGLVLLGRSDATLNPGGVRIGTADIYRVVDRTPEVEDSVVIGQSWENDVRVILFVKMKADRVLDESLKNRIVQTIRTEVSPRHVPARIIAVPDIPYTRNMKKVELAVKRVVEGQTIPNREALANPEALTHFANLAELKK
ncbi:MAG: acetoacetate--CoA ligase [bacterium]|nr:acetoacetate--CoA ligase [bacterium]